MTKVRILILLLSFLTLVTNAQVKTPQQKLDSIFAEDRAHPKEDSVKLVNYKAIYKQYMRMKNEEKMDEYIAKSVALANKINLRVFEADAYMRRGMYYHGKSNYQKSAENYHKAITVYNAIQDLEMVAGVYQNLGALYEGIPDYAKALTYTLSAMSIYQKLNRNDDLGGIYTNIAGIYIDLKQPANALNYLNKALKIFLGSDPRGEAVVYNSIANTYLDANNQELALMGLKPDEKYAQASIYLDKGLKVAHRLNDASVLKSLYKNLGILHERQGSRDLALQAYTKSLTYSKADDNTTDLADVMLTLANFHLQDKAYEKASTLLNEALKIGRENQALEVLQNAYELMSKIQELQGNYAASLESYRNYISARDEIFNEEKEKEITRKQLQIDFAVKEKDYQLKQQVTDAALQRQFLLARQQEQQLKLRKQQLALSDQEKVLQRLTFLKKQTDLENEKRIQENLLEKEQLKANLDKQIRNKQILLQQTELRFNRNVNLFLGILAATLFAASVLVYRAKHKTTKLNQLVLAQKLELEKLGGVKDRIFSVVSHDMRAPVNSLIAFIQLLEGGQIHQEKLVKYAANLKHTLGYTSAMMENLLNWASSQMHGFKPVLEPFDMRLCVADVINSMEALAAEKQISIENNVDKGSICLADSNMTALIIRNLISNSIKFTPNQGKVQVTATIQKDEIFVEVKDNGVGLSEEQLETFNRSDFQQTGKTTLGTNNEKGTGIGLVLCKTFTSLMHGKLEAANQIDGGSIFILRLPKAIS